MAETVAGTYEIIERIGSGGAGAVYLANHLRLGKKVVLKEDKRMLSVRPEILRREVDVLKDLRHSYVPQVYDFFTENEYVYTVMDYIEGESLDKPLKRNVRFVQPQVIRWGCELLEALCYLHKPIHGTPPHGIVHSDIKPANVVLTPYGGICLIDYNVALLLGEENAIGRSEGYASPEHYGLNYSSGSGTADEDATASLQEEIDPTASLNLSAGAGPLSKSDPHSSSKKSVIPDTRSDIYSLGATLYHLLTGIKPLKNAVEVVPLSKSKFSPQIVDILSRAMNPNPDLRWQTAEEMLYALTHLRENDPRARRLKRDKLVSGILVAAMFLFGGFFAFTGSRRMETLEHGKRMAAYAGDSLRAGDVDGAIRFALQAIPGKQDIFTPPVTAEAQKALTDALQVYDLSDGFKAHKTVELPAAPLYLALSPDGKTAACVYAWSVVLFDTDSAEILAEFPAVHSALAEVHFSDNDIVVYAGNVGLEAYDIRKGRKLWTTNRLATSIALSADCRYIATVYSEESTAFIYNAVDGQIIREVRFDGKNQRTAANASFANPGDNLLALSPDGALLAVSFADGSLWIYDLRDRENDLELFDAASGYTRFEGGFHKQYFAFTASGPSGSVFAVVDTAEQAQTGGFSSSGRFSVQTDETGIYVQTDNLLVKLDPVTGEQSPLVATAEYITNFARSDGYTLMTSKEELLFFDRRTNLVSRHALLYSGAHVQIAEGTAVAGSLDSPVLRIWKLENHIEAGIFSYDPDYRHDEARISADGRSVMLFSYGGFRLYDINGAILAETEIPDAEQLYDHQYRRDEAGSRLEVIYNDGTIRAYSAEDGSLRYEVAGMAPDLSLYEEFFTDTLRFTSPLHGTPAAYDRKSGRLVRELEKDAYLTYVTQAGEYIVTEYVTADGARYGLLLNERCETLAYLPNLCDILGDRLIFDYPSGSLRESRIYDLDELIGLARR